MSWRLDTRFAAWPGLGSLGLRSPPLGHRARRIELSGTAPMFGLPRKHTGCAPARRGPDPAGSSAARGRSGRPGTGGGTPSCRSAACARSAARGGSAATCSASGPAQPCKRCRGSSRADTSLAGPGTASPMPRSPRPGPRAQRIALPCTALLLGRRLSYVGSAAAGSGGGLTSSSASLALRVPCPALRARGFAPSGPSLRVGVPLAGEPGRRSA